MDITVALYTKFPMLSTITRVPLVEKTIFTLIARLVTPLRRESSACRYGLDGRSSTHNRL